MRYIVGSPRPTSPIWGWFNGDDLPFFSAISRLLEGLVHHLPCPQWCIRAGGDDHVFAAKICDDLSKKGRCPVAVWKNHSSFNVPIGGWCPSGGCAFTKFSFSVLSLLSDSIFSGAKKFLLTLTQRKAPKQWRFREQEKRWETKPRLKLQEVTSHNKRKKSTNCTMSFLLECVRISPKWINMSRDATPTNLARTDATSNASRINVGRSCPLALEDLALWHWPSSVNLATHSLLQYGQFSQFPILEATGSIRLTF